MISEKHNFIILMPPKTASNSITKSLKDSGIDFLKDNSNHPKIHLRLKEIVERHKLENLEKFKIFQIVRNPYDRFISAFYYQTKLIPRDSSIKFVNYNISKFIEHLFESKNSENFLETFFGNLSFVHHSINSGKNWGGSRLFDSQTSWNDLKTNIKFFKLETLSYDISPLSDYLGINLKKLNHLNSQEIDTKNLSTKDMKIISEIYHEDFVNFDYKK